MNGTLTEHPCPFCEGQPVSPDCAMCGGSGTLVDITPVVLAMTSPDIESRPDLDALRTAAQNLSDRRTLMDDGFWVSQKEMRALDAALAAATGDSRQSEGLLHTWAGHIGCDPADCTVAHMARTP